MNVTARAIQRISTLASVTLAFTTPALAQYEQIQDLGSADGHVMVSGDFNLCLVPAGLGGGCDVRSERPNLSGSLSLESADEGRGQGHLPHVEASRIG